MMELHSWTTPKWALPFLWTAPHLGHNMCNRLFRGTGISSALPPQATEWKCKGRGFVSIIVYVTFLSSLVKQSSTIFTQIFCQCTSRKLLIPAYFNHTSLANIVQPVVHDYRLQIFPLNACLFLMNFSCWWTELLVCSSASQHTKNLTVSNSSHFWMQQLIFYCLAFYFCK